MWIGYCTEILINDMRKFSLVYMFENDINV